MKIAAIICEYNPFHNGHSYQIKQIRQQLSADHIIAVMSGDFVQRGTPAFCNKCSRAEFALHNGIDLVIELPVCYSCSSAEFFAYGAVSLLDSLNCVDDLVFGTETGALDSLKLCADLFIKEPEDYKQCLQKQLRNGQSFPSAKAYAASKTIGKDLTSILNAPNNILAIEYLKALHTCNSGIRPYTIRRTGAGYHDTDLSSVASASGIRKTIFQNGIRPELQNFVPKDVYRYFKEFYNQTFPMEPNDFSEMIFYRLMTESSPEKYMDAHPELISRIMNIRHQCDNIETLVANSKSKNFTYARISRYLFHLMLSITQEDASSPCPYAKILGMKKSHSELLKYIKQVSKIPIIQKTAGYRAVLNEEAIHSYEQTLTATELYRYMIHKKYHTPQTSECSQSLLIV